MTAPTKSEIKPLSKTEGKEFAKLDAVIKTGAKTFMEVGMALVTMHKGKLYRAEFQTFEAYCETRGIKRGQAYNLMSAVQMTLELPNVPHVEQTSVRALRKLATVKPEKRAEVFNAAARKAGGPPKESQIVEAKAEVVPSDEPINLNEPCETLPEPPDELETASAGELPEPLTALPVVYEIISPLPKTTPLTPLKFLDELLSLEKRIPTGLTQKERECYGIHANALAGRLMNPAQKTFSAYTR